MDVLNDTQLDTICTINNTIDLRNATSLPPQIVYQPGDWIFYYVIWPSLMVFGTLSNISFIWTVIRTSTLHTSTYIYLVSLAFADLSNILGFGFLFVIDYSTSRVRNTNIIFSAFVYMISMFAFISSMGFVTLVSLERYLAICYPIRHHVLKGTKRTYRLIIAVLVISGIYVVCIVFPTFFGNAQEFVTCITWPEEERYGEYPDYVLSYVPRINHAHQLFNLLLHLLSWFSAVISSCYMYVCILRTMMIRAENRQLNVSNGFEKQLRQVGIMVITNGTIFFLCCSIQIINQIITILVLYEIKIFNGSNFNSWLHFVVVSIGVNSSINPLIYYSTNQRYRKAFRSVYSIDCGSADENRQKVYNPRPREVVSTL